MNVVGITGQIGCGKSFLCKILREHGVPTYDCDKGLKELLHTEDMFMYLYKQDQNLYVVSSHGPFYSWNKAYVMEMMKSDPEFMPRLESWFMPYLIKDIQLFIDEADATGFQCAAIESATLASMEILDMIDRVVVVTADKETQMGRIRHRDPSRTAADIETLISRQNRTVRHKSISHIRNDDSTSDDQIWSDFIEIMKTS